MNELITLIKVVTGKGSTGAPDQRGTPIRRDVFAELRSIGMSEYYKAQAIGITLTAVAVVYRCDYDEETEVEFNGKTHDVIRTYTSPKDHNRIELHLKVRSEV